MANNVWVNRDRSKVVPVYSAEAKWQISRKEAVELGLLDSADAPVQQRRAAFDSVNAKTPPQRRRTTRRK